MKYLKKLEEIEARFDGISGKMADPATLSDHDQYTKTARAHRELEPIVDKFRQWKKINEELEGAKGMLEESDPELREMAREDVARLTPELTRLEEELKVLLLPADPNDERNVVLEIRAGTGGDEATLFAAEIFRMYCRYAEDKRWRVEVTSSSESGVGGLKEVIALVNGDRVYSRLKYESGVHRVQRVPETETQGRIHTSAVTVAVLPEADDVEIKIDPKDLRIDTFCSSGPGGQSVNTTYSAVRISHMPTNLVVSGREVADQEPGQGGARAALPAVRAGTEEAAGRDRRRAAQHGGHG